jgi:uncharacterized protein YceH (UPF0502 family)
MLPFDLDAAEARVLGCLAEKDLATPSYYPLSLHALVAACNQKSNRDPVVEYEESDVLAALNRLEQKDWVLSVLEPGSRVTRYRHRLVERLELRPSEQAVLTVLLLRGPQTPGELRSRTERLHDFPDVDAVLTVLRRLAAREPAPLVRQLDRLPGMKENRWAHLLSGEPVQNAPAGPPAETGSSRLADLEQRLAALEQQLAGQAERISQLEDALRRISPGSIAP